MTCRFRNALLSFRDESTFTKDVPVTTPPPAELLDKLEEASYKLGKVQDEVKSVIFGQDQAILGTLTALLSGGHVLLLGLPGLAKTRLVTVLAKTLGLETKRIQCTPDLMPSDIIGAEVLEEVDYGRRNFRFIHGPVFTQFLMVDEINRANPRTQSALLQAMQEGHVTVMGHEHNLPVPFHVWATQTPLEQDGVYPLPEAQRDRFMIQIDIPYPDPEAEKKVVMASTTGEEKAVETVMYANDLRAFQTLVRSMPMPETLVDKLVALVRSGRPQTSTLPLVRDYVSWGPGPRAAQAFSLAARANALLDGRLAPIDQDFYALAKPILRHRMGLNFKARTDGVAMDDVIAAMIAAAGA
jgi:MoxR-like ATPase